MHGKERGYMVACKYHEACQKGAAMLDAQGVHGLEVPMPPQPEAEPTRATWMREGKRVGFHTLVHLLKTGHHTIRNYDKLEVKAPRRLRGCSQSRCAALWFF